MAKKSKAKKKTATRKKTASKKKATSKRGATTKSKVKAAKKMAPKKSPKKVSTKSKVAKKTASKKSPKKVSTKSKVVAKKTSKAASRSKATAKKASEPKKAKLASAPAKSVASKKPTAVEEGKSSGGKSRKPIARTKKEIKQAEAYQLPIANPDDYADGTVMVETSYGTYTRLDYIKNWEKIKKKEALLQDHRLENVIEELVAKYPEKYIEVLCNDLSSEANFNRVVLDLKITQADEVDDEYVDDEEEDAGDELIGSIRRDFDKFEDDDSF